MSSNSAIISTFSRESSDAYSRSIPSVGLYAIISSGIKKAKDSPSQTTLLARKAVPSALNLLAKADGKNLRVRDLLEQMGSSLEFTDWEQHRHPSGDIRWRKIFAWYSLGMADAGFIVKRSGVWYLTPIGEAAIGMSPEQTLAKMDEAYWAKREGTESTPGNKTEKKEDEPAKMKKADAHALALDEAVAQASEGLRAHLNSLDPWEAQRLVAGILRAMDYHTPFIAPENQRDGGLDILAYRDPLGALGGRVKVQVKHKPESKGKADREEIQRLTSMVNSDTQEMGLFVSTQGFTQPARDFARDTKQHIELWDGERLLDSWREFYPRLDEGTRAIMRLRPVYFLDPDRTGTDHA